jgi:DNA-binding MurR/RpiR family transcriptional regulator
MDFGVLRQDVAAQFDVSPAALVRLAGECGLELSLSQYLADGGSEREPNWSLEADKTKPSAAWSCGSTQREASIRASNSRAKRK